MEPTAGMAVIGEEILSGKVVDENARFLIGELRALGVRLRRIDVLPDDIDVIADAVRALSSTVDTVFTSGGVGTTHDDVTMAGIARGFGVPLVRLPAFVEKLEAFYGDALDETRLRLAEVPEGAELVTGEPAQWTAVRFENIYILPGVPALFRGKFNALKEQFRAPPYVVARAYLHGEESSIAEALTGLDNAHVQVRFGSYPRFDDSDYSVLITLEGKDREAVVSAFTAVTETFRDQLVRTEDPS